MGTTTGQLAIIDVTDASNPTLVSTFTLPNMTYASDPQDIWGREIAYYDRKIYITTRAASGPELHVVDVSTPAAPSELGSKELGFTVLSMAVRDEYQAGSVHRMLYAATGRDGGEIAILDLTSLASIPVYSFDLPDTDKNGGVCNLSDKPNAISIVPLGRRLYAGREHNASGACSNLEDLYMLDISNPSAPTVLARGTAGGGVIGLRASGDLLFVLVSSLAQPTVGGLLDIDGSYAYVGNTSASKLQVWGADPSSFAKIGEKPLSGSKLQVFRSN
jgi:hypothetical protein